MGIEPAQVPRVGDVLSVTLQITTFAVLAVCIMRRTQFINKWAALPLAMWLVLSIYCDSAVFVFATAIIVHGFGINSSPEVCDGGILLCLICYMTTKILIYYFLVEKAYIIRGSMAPRMKTKLWLFNCLGMLLPYTIFVIMNFVYRIAYINDEGVCIIGMQKLAMYPLIIFEVIVNIYLTLLFIIPLRSLYSYKHSHNPVLRRVAFRSFFGSLSTLTTSAINLTILMVLEGEPGWICLMCCNADILFCVLVLHWVTGKDKNCTYSQHTLEDARSNSEDMGVVARIVEAGGGSVGEGKDGAEEEEKPQHLVFRTWEMRNMCQHSHSNPNPNPPQPQQQSQSQSRSLGMWSSSPSFFTRSLSRPRTSITLSASAPPSVTTECSRSSSSSGGGGGNVARFDSRNISRSLDSLVGTRGGNEEVVLGLNNIRVQTVHTREVVGGGGGGDGGDNSDRMGRSNGRESPGIDEGMEKEVGGEGIV